MSLIPRISFFDTDSFFNDFWPVSSAHAQEQGFFFTSC